MLILSNEWIIWVANTYGFVILAIPSVITFLLKLIAIINPNVPTDQITDLFKQFWPKGKGVLKKPE